jgi:hypothetical protein
VPLSVNIERFLRPHSTVTAQRVDLRVIPRLRGPFFKR